MVKKGKCVWKPGGATLSGVREEWTLNKPCRLGLYIIYSKMRHSRYFEVMCVFMFVCVCVCVRHRYREKVCVCVCV